MENENATTKLKQFQHETRDREERLATEIQRLHAHELNAQQQKVGQRPSFSAHLSIRSHTRPDGRVGFSRHAVRHGANN